METRSEVTSELDNPAVEDRNQSLGLPEIFRPMLEQLSNEEFFEVSHVNELWSYVYDDESVLDDECTSTAKVGLNYPACLDLGKFARDLDRIRIVPFDGMNLLLANDHDCNSSFTGRLRLVYIPILERLPWKTFSVHFDSNWEACLCHPPQMFVQKLLQDFGGVLESLSVTFRWQDAKSVQKLLLNGSFTQLKTLKLDVKNTDRNFTGFVKALVARAPNLQELHIVRDIGCFYENVLEGSSAVLVPHSDFHPLFYRVCESLLGALRPETIVVHRHYGGYVDLDVLKRLLPRVLRASSTSLKTMRMDFLLAVPLMCYGVCLENVTTLQMQLELSLVYTLKLPRIFDLLKAFDFTRIFPKLNQIEITCNGNSTLSPENITSSFFMEKGTRLLAERGLDPAPYTKSLTLRGTVLDNAVAFCAQSFSDVRRLSVEDETFETPFRFLWVYYFEKLEELTLIIATWPICTRNLDSVFCGISPEEAAELRKEDDQYLKDVNIVPVMPPITSLTEGLRTFTFFPVRSSGRSRATRNWSRFYFFENRRLY